jgi:hypothetical protein
MKARIRCIPNCSDAKYNFDEYAAKLVFLGARITFLDHSDRGERKRYLGEVQRLEARQVT